MSALPDSIGAFARGVGRVLRVPTGAMLVLATAALTLATLLAVVNAVTADTLTAGHVVVLALPVVLAVPVVVFAIRRRRWFRLTTRSTGPVVSTEILSPDDLADRVEEQMRGQPGAEDVQVVLDAFTESQLPAGYGGGRRGRVNRWLGSGRLGVVGYALGRVEKAQRALLVAAGGPVQAPYLRDDLRISGLALIGTLLAIPLASLLAIILALVLLSS
ncbi:hypothetical protein [Ruania halotolerans]|uniref:hypothetical protein n=1 Tax=Ruania halotolerans TaxID=2897773 RepID=UPI001E53CD7D|nr:hypothetical protein [Ruania halotolerans]UFU04943.1 hypothetical protein LQF10_10670 [Ruania halotolerans]